MAGEQDIGKGGDQVRFDRTERTAESTAEDSVIAGDRKLDHQQRHQDFKQTENQNTLSDAELITPLPGESLEAYKRRVEEIQLNRFGFEGDLTPEDMGGKTFSTTFKHGNSTVYERPARQALEPIPPPSPVLDETPYDSPVTLNVQATNVPEVPDPVSVEYLGQYGARVLEAGAQAVRPLEKWLATPNAVNDALSGIGSALETAANYYASTPADQVMRDDQAALGTISEAVIEHIDHPMTPEERARTAGMILPLFFFEGNAKEPINPKSVEQMGLESLSEAELKALGIESRPVRMVLERDEFSIQATIHSDNAAFFRATMPEPGVVDVDSIFKGSLPSGSDFLAHALKSHNAIPSKRLVFSGIVNAETKAAFEQGIPAADSLIGRSGARALESLGIEPKSFRYEVVRGKLNLVIDTQ